MNIPAILLPLIPMLVHLAESHIPDQADSGTVAADRKAFVQDGLKLAWDFFAQMGAIPAWVAGNEEEISKLVDKAIEFCLAKLEPKAPEPKPAA